jgi:hypothetical protein
MMLTTVSLGRGMLSTKRSRPSTMPSINPIRSLTTPNSPRTMSALSYQLSIRQMSSAELCGSGLLTILARSLLLLPLETSSECRRLLLVLPGQVIRSRSSPSVDLTSVIRSTAESRRLRVRSSVWLMMMLSGIQKLSCRTCWPPLKTRESVACLVCKGMYDESPFRRSLLWGQMVLFHVIMRSIAPTSPITV